MEPKALDGAVSLAQTLSGWALLILAGSILALVSSAYHQPLNRWRWIYVLFFPGWAFLVASMYFGVNVHRAYLGYLFTSSIPAKFNLGPINDDALWQIVSIELAVVCFGLWVTGYLLWWLFSTDARRG